MSISKNLLRKINTAQKYLKENNIDAWIIYQFINQNPFFDSFFEGKKKITTRRTFLVIPKKGNPTIIHSKIDDDFYDLGIGEITYTSYEEFVNNTRQLISKFKTCAMEYSLNSQIPHVSKVDAGIVDLVRSFGTKVVSSADLLQLTSQLEFRQLTSHVKAAKKLDQVRIKAFSQIKKELKENKEVSEYSIQQMILKLIKENGLETIYEPEINVNENATKGHYLPTKNKSLIFKKGDLLLIDMWAKLKEKDSIYADITWVLYRGKTAPQKILDAFNSVIKARDKAVNYLHEKIFLKQKVSGWEVDKIARDSINSDGYEKYFTHRLGHSLGTFVHGDLVHFDNFENKDDRQIMPGHVGTIEPGIYIPGEFGIRSEINILVKENEVEVSTEKQKELYYVNL